MAYHPGGYTKLSVSHALALEKNQQENLEEFHIQVGTTVTSHPPYSKVTTLESDNHLSYCQQEASSDDTVALFHMQNHQGFPSCFLSNKIWDCLGMRLAQWNSPTLTSI